MDTNIDRSVRINTTKVAADDGVKKTIPKQKTEQSSNSSSYFLAKKVESSFLDRLSCWWGTETFGGLSYLFNPTDNNVSTGVRMSLMRCDDHAAAAENAIAIIRDADVQPHIQMKAADTLADLGMKDEAKEAYLIIAKTLGLENHLIRTKAADALVEMGMKNEAKEAYLFLSKSMWMTRNDTLKPSVVFRMNVASGLVELGVKEIAKKIYLGVVKDFLKLPNARMAAADSLARMGEKAEAREAYFTILNDKSASIEIKEQAKKELLKLTR